LNVDSPTSTQDSFHVHLTEALVGAKPGVQVTITYKLVVVDPGQQEHVLQGPVSVTNSLGGGHAQSTIGYWPPQNGEFIFRVVRIDGPTETVLAERRATTDKAAVVAPALPPNVSLGGGFAITGLRITPDQPVVGLPVTIEVAATNSGPEPVTQAVPVVLTDDSGELT